MTLSAIDLEIARNRLSGIAEEMGIVLRRTAYSPNIKERADCSAAVFTADGQMLAQAEHIPVHLGAMPASVAAVIERFDPEPGVQYAVNDPYAGGTHLNDLTIVEPVFVMDRLVGWVGNRAHHADVGGEAPGSMPAHATILAQEGIVIAPMAAARGGAWLDGFIEPFLDATRTPLERRGDLSAQLGANHVGAMRLSSLVGDDVAGYQLMSATLLDYGERRMSAAIGALHPGRYRFTDYMEFGEEDVAITVDLDVASDHVTADFSASDDQVAANFNAVEAVTRSCLYYAIRVVTDPSIPANGGSYRAASLITRPGSIVSATAPAAVAAGNVETSQRIADVLLGAFVDAAPGRVPAASQGTMNNILIGNDHFAYYETVAGGQGASSIADGQSGIQTGMTNTKNTPIESIERHYPFQVTRYTLRRGSGGRGQWCGGDGIEREIRFGEDATLSLMGERRRHQPWGLAGGESGASGTDMLTRADGSVLALPGKVTIDVSAGDVLTVRTPGGGGYGPPI